MTVGSAASYAASEQRFFLGSESLSDIGYASVLSGDDSADGTSPQKNLLPFPTEKVKEENEKRLEEMRSDEKPLEETVAEEETTPVEPPMGCTSKEIPVIREGELVGCKAQSEPELASQPTPKINIIQ